MPIFKLGLGFFLDLLEFLIYSVYEPLTCIYFANIRIQGKISFERREVVPTKSVCSPLGGWAFIFPPFQLRPPLEETDTYLVLLGAIRGVFGVDVVFFTKRRKSFLSLMRVNSYHAMLLEETSREVALGGKDQH